MVRYTDDPCDELMQQYNQTVQQRQQQEWEASVAAPLRKQIAEQQKQIADQQNQIQTLQVKIESQTTAALQSEARNRAALDLVGACLGVGLAFFMAVGAYTAAFLGGAKSSSPYAPLGLGLSFLAASHCKEEIALERLAAVSLAPEPMIRRLGLIYR